ncbi:MAG: hypothetical protein ACREN8_06640 [Candidatus Dormibacteraceae bacterium]
MNQQIVQIRLVGSLPAVAAVASELKIGLEVIDDSGSFACRRDKEMWRRHLQVAVSESEMVEAIR